MLWRDVGLLWEVVWKLPPEITARASELLHAIVWEASFEKEITVSLMMLLASKARRIVLVRTDHDLDRFVNPMVFQLCGVHRSQHELQELDLQGVDLGTGLTFLLHLLPQCTKLNILKLGSNSSDEVLYATQACPIKVLYISERPLRQNLVSQELLMELLFGIRNEGPKDVLHAFKCRKPVYLNPTWPLLNEVCFGSCNVEPEFLILVLLFFPGIRWVSKNLFETQRIIIDYYHLMLLMRNLHHLSLRTSSVIVNTSFLDILPFVAPQVEEVKVVTRGQSGFTYIQDMFKLGTMFQSLRSVRMTDLVHFCPTEPPFEMFRSMGPRLRSLELYGGKIGVVKLVDLKMCLQLCPFLEELTLAFTFGIVSYPDDLNLKERFENLKSLKCVSHQLRHQALKCLLRLLPNLEKFTVSGSVDNIDLLLMHLINVPELRVLKVNVGQVFGVGSLCGMPRDTKDKRPWQLYAPTQCVAQVDKRKLMNCGWTYTPLSPYNSD